jgi:phosphoribosylaminoimidazole-succinocarboxamide synthase
VDIKPTNYELPPDYTHIYSGKVRDLYRTPENQLLFVASDRISAYDWVMPTEIPDKGKILTALSLWWFDKLKDIVPNHVISIDVPQSVAGRAMICQSLEMFPVECVARGYLAGSGLAEYKENKKICGNALPDGLVDGSRLPNSIFTPATKAELGDHDENVDFNHVVKTIGQADANTLRDLTLAIYERAEEVARTRNVILADTKFEFGRAADGQILLADEVLTPDSSRYWPAELWAPGASQPSFDKQFLRDWLTSSASDWDRFGSTPPPALPPEVVAGTHAKYVEAYERLTGLAWS